MSTGNLDMTIALPEDESPGELIKGYYTLMRAFGWDLYVTAHFALRDTLGPSWFAERMNDLTRDDPKNWKPNYKFDPQDCSVVLRDYVFEHDTPYAGVFGGQFQKQSQARKILGTRNTWFHFGDDPTLSQLGETAKVVRSFVAKGGMHIQPRIDRLIERLDDIRTGRYPVPIVTVTAPASELMATAEVDVATVELPSDLPRPGIGGTWLGHIPELRYKITRTGDVVHPDTMKSIRGQVTGDFAEKFRAWTSVEPRGRQVWIDPADGALGGYIGASPRLLGYLGPDPVGEIARGFFIPHYYAIEGDQVVDLDTEAKLQWDASANVASGTSLRVTTYGDVVTVDDVEGVERVATVTPAEWFPGHLD